MGSPRSSDIRNRTAQGHAGGNQRALVAPGLVRQRFDDFDELCEQVQGWDLDLCLFDCVPFAAELTQTLVGQVMLSRARFDGHLQQLGSPPPGCWTFGIPEPKSTPFHWRGHEVAPGQLLVFRPGSQLDSVSKRGFRVFTCSFPERLLNEAALATGQPHPASTAEHADVVESSGASSRALQNWLLGFFDTLEGAPSAVHSPDVVRRVERDLPALVLEALASGLELAPTRPVGTRGLLLRRAMAYIDEHGRKPLTVGEISAAVGAHERTLRRAFLDQFGVPPKTYLTALRLGGVRKELRRLTPESPVADVANGWGFWHMGDFAMKYRRVFGELPSETLKSRGVK